jgi:hypothetical protein
VVGCRDSFTLNQPFERFQVRAWFLGLWYAYHYCQANQWLLVRGLSKINKQISKYKTGYKFVFKIIKHKLHISVHT